MGNTSDTPETPKKSKINLLQHYTFSHFSDSYHFGEIKVYKSNEDLEKFIFVKEIPMDNELTIDYYKENMKNFDVSNVNFQTLSIEFINSETTQPIFCGCTHASRIVTGIEPIERDLNSEIKKRFLQVDYYPENEIWYIQESIMNIEKIQIKKNRIHGEIRADHIFVNDEGMVKFIDPQIIDYKLDSYMKTQLGISRSPIGPELQSSVKERKKISEFNQIQNEVWMIGIVILCMDYIFYLYMLLDHIFLFYKIIVI